MLRLPTLLLSAAVLTGCATFELQEVDPGILTCDVNPGPCAFDQTPLRVLPDPVVLPKRPYQFFPTAQRLNFIDARGQRWVAPQRTLTDGASIPPIFVPIVGDPTSPEFIGAAAVHDAYCGVGNEDGPNFQGAYWEDVHIMFYDGLIAGGTQPLVAKIMFSAVWLGGPRWRDPGIGPDAVISTQGFGDYILRPTRSLDHVPVRALQQAMRETKAFIETEEPTFNLLLAYLRQKEWRLLQEHPVEPLDPVDGIFDGGGETDGGETGGFDGFINDGGEIDGGTTDEFIETAEPT